MKIWVYIVLSLAPVTAHATRQDALAAIKKASVVVGIPERTLRAVCMVESSLNTSLKPHVDGSTLSYGICQVKLSTASHIDKVYKHKYLASPARLSVTYINALYAAKYLKLQWKRYGYDWNAAIDGFNKGRLVNRNSQYVRKVMLAMENSTSE